ncbi:MAG: hypothetical protein ACTSU9_11190 [Promethearchaeota archaeon]
MDGDIGSNQSDGLKPPFNGMYINYTFSTNAPGMSSFSNGCDVFSTPPTGAPGALSVESSIANRSVNITSREIAMSENADIADGTHDWVWVPTSSQAGVDIPVAVRNSSEQQFQIVANATFRLNGKTHLCWKLTSGEGV